VSLPSGNRHLGFGNRGSGGRRRGFVREVVREVVEESGTFDPLTLAAEGHLHEPGDVAFLLLDRTAELADEGEEFLDLVLEVGIVGEQLDHLLAEGEDFAFEWQRHVIDDA
jgi:hypothetical protein